MDALFCPQAIVWGTAGQILGAAASTLAALVALGFGLATRRESNRRDTRDLEAKFQRAITYSNLFDFELRMICHWAEVRFGASNPDDIETNQLNFLATEQYVKDHAVAPMLERLFDRMDHFPVEVGNSLGRVLTQLLSLRRQHVYSERAFAALSPELRRTFTERVRTSSAILLQSTNIALNQMWEYIGADHLRENPVDPIPTEVLEVLERESDSTSSPSTSAA